MLNIVSSMGNSAPIAYGGFALGTALKCACNTIDQDKYRVYSAQGSFLGPASIDRPLECSVRHLRSTKSFMTRLVEVGQTQDDGKFRICLIMLADFHIQETKSMFDYSVPQPQYTPIESCMSLDEHVKKMLEDGKISQKMAGLFKASFGIGRKYFEQRVCPEGMASERLYGVAKHLPSAQDGLDLTDRRSAEWVRLKGAFSSPGDHASALAFLMDAALAFIPLTHTGQFLDDAATCSSLDYSLRFFEGGLKANDWHLREWRTMRGAHARTFSEGRLFAGGKMIISMTQQSIMRPKASI